jgi:integrase
VAIDRCDRISLKDAKAKAKALMSTIASGIDPTAKPKGTGITLSQALELHIEEKRPRPRTEESYRYHVDKYLKAWKNKPVAHITRTDCRDLFNSLKSKSGETTASGVMRTLRAIINSAMLDDETIPSNPVSAVRVPGPKKRKVAPIDLASWWETVQELSPIRRDVHIAMLLTGARRASILPVKREDVRLDEKVLRFTHMKTKDEPMLFPMGPRLAALLKARMEEDEPLNSEWLWPSPTSKSGHCEEPKESGLPSPHQYRHLASTLLIQSGCPYAESSLLLGRTLPGATGSYIHPEMLVETLRVFSERLEELVFSHRPAPKLALVA